MFNNKELSARKVGELAQAAIIRSELVRVAASNTVYALASEIAKQQPIELATPEKPPMLSVVYSSEPNELTETGARQAVEAAHNDNVSSGNFYEKEAA
jgi:hypothetical protein